MADRYAVAIVGSVNWTGVNTAIWSDVSGGAGGFSVPTNSDNVYFDANSGSGTCTVGNGVTVTTLNFVTTGFTGTLVGFNSATAVFNIAGLLTLGSSMTLTSNISTWSFTATTDNGGSGFPVTTNGKVLGTVNFNGVGGKWALQDALTCNANHTVTNGHFVSTPYTVTCLTGSGSNSNTRTIDFTGSTVNITSTAAATYLNYATITGLTFFGSTATFNIVNASANGKTIGLGSVVTIGTLNYTVNASTGGLTINNSGRIRTLNVSDATNGRAITLSANPTIDVWNVQGGSGRVMAVASNTGGTPRTINLLGPGPQTTDYVNYTDIRVSSPYKLFATNATDGGGNRNINFSSALSAPLNRQMMGANTGAATTTSATFEYPTVAGNKIIVMMAWANADPGVITKPSDVTLEFSHNRSTNVYVKGYSKVASGSETSFTFSWVNSVASAIYIYEINSFTGTLDFDTSQTNDSVSATSLVTGAGVANSSAPAIAIALVGGNGGMGVTTTEATNSFQDELYTVTNATGAIGKIALKPLTSVASQSTTISWTSSRVPASVLAIYKVTAPAGGNTGGFFVYM